MEFEDQEIRWRYLPENDVLVATLRYQGIYGGKEDKKRPLESISKKQAQQLASVMEVERAFFFNNWISEFNRAAFEQKLSESDQVHPSIQSKLFKLLLQEIKVVKDQFNNPTWTRSMSDIIELSIENDLEGIIHWGDSVHISRFEFAKLIAKKFSLNESLIKPVLRASVFSVVLFLSADFAIFAALS